jgi:hypothetical protein
MSKEMNNADLPSFDLFAPPVDDHLKEELAKGKYEWTNKYTRLLAGAFVVVALLSAGAWYGHHSATATSATGLSLNRTGFATGFAGGAGGGSARARNSGTTTSQGGGIPGGFGGGGPRVTGTVTKVSGSEVTIKLDDPTQSSSLKSGDTTRVTNTTGFGAPAGAPSGGTVGQVPNPASTSTTNKANSNSKSTTTKSGVKSPTGSAGSARPTFGSAGGAGGGAGRGGGFNNPEITACLAKEGVTLTPGARPDRTDPKIAAAFAKCLPGGFGGGGQRPSGGAPSPAPSN